MKEEQFFILTRSPFNSITLFVLVLLFPFFSFSQISQVGRYEIPISNDYADMQIIPSGADGLFLLQDIAQSDQDGRLWKATLLDTALNEKWQNVFSLDRSLQLIRTDTLGGSAFALLRSYRDARIMQILELKNDGQVLSAPFKNLIPMSITHFIVFDNGKRVLIGGYFNFRPVLVIYDIRTNRPRILPGLINEPGDLLQLEKNVDSKTFNALIRSNGRVSERGIWLMSYSFDGKLVKNIRLNLNKKVSLSSAKVSQINDSTHMIAGPFGVRNSAYSKGLYIAKIGMTEIYDSKMIYYSELPNFFDFMNFKRKERIQRRIAKKNLKGKRPRFNFKVIIQDLAQKNGELVIIGEAHYEKYNESRYSTRSFGSFGMPNMMFDGYVYTNAFLVGIDESGDLKWDQSIKTKNVKKYDLDQLVQYYTESDQGILMYPSSEKLCFTVFQTELRGPSTEGEVEIELSHPNDFIKTREHHSSDLKYWYKNHYFVHGKQLIKNMTDTSVPLNRRVYYINKIQYSQSPEPN